MIRVGITASVDPGKLVRPGLDYLYLRRDYSSVVKRVGGIPLLLSPDVSAAQAVELCDGLVISGGGDLPTSFDVAFAPETAAGEAEEPERVAWERTLLDAFDAAHKPVLGVCYGMQLMNLHFGGTLHRDVRQDVGQHVAHGQVGASTRHDVEIAPDSVLLAGLGHSMEVNSSHVQAVKAVAHGFSVAAWASDGVVEAIECDHLLGVEWHPESDATGARVYGHLVERCRQ